MSEPSDIETLAQRRQHHWSKPWSRWDLNYPHSIRYLTKQLEEAYVARRKVRVERKTETKAASAAGQNDQVRGL